MTDFDALIDSMFTQAELEENARFLDEMTTGFDVTMGELLADFGEEGSVLGELLNELKAASDEP